MRSKHDTHILVALPYSPCNIHTVFISDRYIKYHYVELVFFPYTDKLIAAFIAVYLYILCTFAYAVCQLFCFRRIFVNYRKLHKNTSSHILTHINNSIKPTALQQKFTGRYSPAKCRIISGQQKSPCIFTLSHNCTGSYLSLKVYRIGHSVLYFIAYSSAVPYLRAAASLTAMLIGLCSRYFTIS